MGIELKLTGAVCGDAAEGNVPRDDAGSNGENWLTADKGPRILSINILKKADSKNLEKVVDTNETRKIAESEKESQTDLQLFELTELRSINRALTEYVNSTMMTKTCL